MGPGDFIASILQQFGDRQFVLVEMYISTLFLFSISFNPEFLYSDSYKCYIKNGSVSFLDHQSAKFLAWLALLLILLS